VNGSRSSTSRLATFFAVSLLALSSAPLRADALDDYARGRMEQLRLPGMAVAVFRNGEVSTMRTWGSADREKNVPVARDTVFELGSLTKQFTAVAVMILAEEGKLTLDESIARYLPEVPEAWAKITVRNLLTHSSGIQEYLARPDLAKRVHAAANQEEVTRLLFEGLPLEFGPGDTWAYSNSGYLLLGSIIERTSGMTYSGFLEKRIFAPLGMRSTRAGDPAKAPKRAVGYDWEGKFVRRDPVPANAFSAGAIVSTIADMARWEAALHAGKLLTKESWKEVWTPLALSHGGTPPFSYGFGWVIDRRHGGPVVLHSGGTAGFSSAIRRYPTEGTAVIVLANRGDRMIDHVAMEIAAIADPDLGRVRQKDPGPMRSARLHRAVKDLLNGTPDAELFTPAMQLFLRTESGRGMWKWIASHGDLRSFRFVEGEPDGNDFVVRYAARLGDAEYSFTVTITRQGAIAQIYWW
jgi:CubicO group peptidase (beta-lactamase class C family)